MFDNFMGLTLKESTLDAMYLFYLEQRHCFPSRFCSIFQTNSLYRTIITIYLLIYSSVIVALHTKTVIAGEILTNIYLFKIKEKKETLENDVKYVQS